MAFRNLKVFPGVVQVNHLPVPDESKRIKPPSRREQLILKLLIWVGVGSIALFVGWYAQKAHIGFLPLYILLTFGFGMKLIRLLHEWYHYRAISYDPPPVSTREWEVDMFTTYCAGEPYEMVLDTLRAMKLVKYPHKTYLCDEANDPYLREACEKLGVIHVYRGPDKTHAKAGNINHALQQATGEIAVILDPDHKPHPEFLNRVLPYFEKEEVGFVQCIQAYKNRNESFVAKGAAEQTYHFYGPMMMSMHRYGTVQAIGANCSFRRAALDEIGGHAPGLSEDMHTAMQLHARGWKSIYVPEPLTRGLVPATLSAYYKQQLKWSRGTLDLLVRVFPKLIRGFSPRQVFHYLTLPIHFLFGLVWLIDFLVPILSLFLALVPLTVELSELLQYAGPMIIMSLIIRQYAQKWVLEEYERGFHFLGGALLVGTWWVFLIGLVYTIFNVKVPYIPTPKEDALRNEWKLNLPNILVCLISLLAIVYGLNVDWSPYSWIMAGFALVNIFILGTVIMMGQQKGLDNFYRRLYGGGRLMRLRVFWYKLRHSLVYPVLRNTYVSLPLVLGMILLGFSIWQQKISFRLDQLAPLAVKPDEGFYLGTESLLSDPGSDAIQTENPLYEAQLLAWPIAWGKGLNEAELAALPPHSQAFFRWEKKGISSDERLQTWREILAGEHDRYLEQMADAIRRWGAPAFLSWEPSPDTLGKRLDSAGLPIAYTYGAANRYVHERFLEAGVSNVTWVWEAAGSPGYIEYHPGGDHIDLLAWQMPAAAADTSFEAGVQPFLKTLSPFPILISNFPDAANRDWLLETLSYIEQVPEIQGLMLGNGSGDALGALTVELKGRPRFASPPRYTAIVPEAHGSAPLSVGASTSGIRVRQERKALPSHSALPYIQGVAYNPGHDWRDGFSPLVRRQLDADFSRIKAMGANVIRRYSPGLYDRNILDRAQAHELGVLYGFWFDPKIDYATDHEAVEAYREKVLKAVAKLKTHEAIWAWGIGNETWGLLKHHFRPSYLPRVRKAYLAMVQQLAADIKRIDPHHPCFSAVEHSEDLSLSLAAMADQVPALDFIGVNSYYDAQIKELDSLAAVHFPDKPYLVSEFGPAGYWDEALSSINAQGYPLEQSSLEKAAQYKRHWEEYIITHRDRNLGGVAFCWRDRMEGTATWFGISDMENVPKPSYFVLQEMWTDSMTLSGQQLFDVFIIPPYYTSHFRDHYIFKLHSSIQTDAAYAEQLDISWYICEDTYLGRMSGVKPRKDGWECRIPYPRRYGDYRVYVRVETPDGLVLTDSKPLYKIPKAQTDTTSSPVISTLRQGFSQISSNFSGLQLP